MIGIGTKALADFVTSGGLNASGVFREMYDILPVALYTTDAHGRITYFNDAAVKLSGRVPELGSDQWCVTWKSFRGDGTPLPHDQCSMAVVLRGGKVSTGIECIAERPDGTRIWFMSYPTALRDAEGRITGGINVLIDITDRKLAEIETNQHFRAIIDTTPECVKIVAADGELLFMNSQGLEMVGAPSAAALSGHSVYDLIAPEDREKFRAMNEQVCRGEKASIEFDIIGFEGKRRHMETHAAPLRQADGSIAQLAGC